ncbi:hypothetical protein GCM10009843_37290 [Nocardioides bigeumensis]|uniref:PH domain-containing protein n=1 Tax=Nocardioides bigeumensis TaxID=433657 RepID=A0ABN2YUA0_9ACTN
MLNADVDTRPPSDYRVAPALAARLVGLTLAVVGLLVFVVTVLVVAAGLDPLALLVVAGLGVLGAALVAWYAGTRARVVHLDELGYRVRFVRGVGVSSARWADVVDATRQHVAGSRCLVLRLRDGRTTTIPVEVVAASPDALTEDVVTRLEAAGGARWK